MSIIQVCRVHKVLLLAKLITENKYYRIKFEKIINYRDKKIVPIMGNGNPKCDRSLSLT